ncbi:MAG TPA: aspartyl protease family protein [Gemmataceae bacterium]|nr:aspartyl protease family protein [Gemmataceae bacterium]
MCDDGGVRPIVEAAILAGDGNWIPVAFLIDPAADRTVVCGEILASLGLPLLSSPTRLEGVGGRAECALIDTQIRMIREAGATVVFKGQFAAFTDPAALDMSVLGRDITNLFALIIDRPQDQVCLLGKGHRYVITSD